MTIHKYWVRKRNKKGKFKVSRIDLWLDLIVVSVPIAYYITHR